MRFASHLATTGGGRICRASNEQLRPGNPAKWRWDLPDHEQVRLTAVTDPAASKVLAWAPDGSRATQRVDVSDMAGAMLHYEATQGYGGGFMVPAGSTSVRLGYGHGPWRRVAEIPMAKVMETRVDGRLYRVKRINNEALTMEYDNDPALDVRCKVTSVAFLNFRQLPITSGHTAAAVGCSAVTFKFIVRDRIAHGVIEANFLSGLNISHGYERYLSRKPGIRIAAMVYVIPIPDWTRHQEEVVFHLDTKTALKFRETDEGIPFIDNTSENGKQFTFS